MSNGHTSGIGNGFLMLLLIVAVVLMVVSGIVMGISWLFHNVLVTVALGAAGWLGITYLFYQTRDTCLTAAVCGGVGGAACFGITSAWAGVFGALAGIAGGVVTAIVLLAIALTIMPKRKQDSWRKAGRS